MRCFVFLIHHWSPGYADIYLRDGRSETERGILISEAYAQLSINQVRYLPFIHAWSGCDTTSAIYGHGKLSFFKKFERSTLHKDLDKLVQIFVEDGHSPEEVDTVGKRLMALVYGDESAELTRLRYTRYQAMIVQKATIDPRRLPPTANAARQHSRRVYLQTSRWRHMDDNLMDPREWGWELTPSAYSPVRTDLPVAPVSLLNVIRCNCKSETNRCLSHTCSCRKYGIHCVEACGTCRGADCNNRDTTTYIHDDF